MGRASKGLRTRVTTRMATPVYEEMVESCEKQGQTMSDWIAQAVAERLKRQKRRRR